MMAWREEGLPPGRARGSFQPPYRAPPFPAGPAYRDYRALQGPPVPAPQAVAPGVGSSQTPYREVS